jgi:hypothetical protein
MCSKIRVDPVCKQDRWLSCEFLLQPSVQMVRCDMISKAWQFPMLVSQWIRCVPGIGVVALMLCLIRGSLHTGSPVGLAVHHTCLVNLPALTHKRTNRNLVENRLLGNGEAAC